MAEFKQLIITNKGQALMAKMVAGAGNVKFTKIAVSDATYTDAQLYSLTSISSIKQSTSISKVSRTNNVAVQIEGAVTNLDLTAGYFMRAIGLYANDPDEGEILYAITIASTAGYMPPYNGITSSGAFFKLVTTVSNASSVSLNVDPSSVATIGDLKELRSQIESLQKVVDDNQMTPFETDVSFTNLPGCNGGFVKLDKVEGRTFKNEIINGNFASGTINWGASGSTHNVSNNVLSNIGDGNIQYPYETQTGSIIVGHKYYIKSMVRVTNTVCTAISLKFDNNIEIKTINNPIQNQWYYSNGITTATTTNMTCRFHHRYIDNATTKGKIMEIQNVMCLDLTALGLENKNIEELDAMIQTYFEGMKHVGEEVTLPDGTKAYRIEISTRKQDLIPVGTTDLSNKQITDVIFNNVGGIEVGDLCEWRAGTTLVRDNIVIKNINGNGLTIDFLQPCPQGWGLVQGNDRIVVKTSNKTEILSPQSWRGIPDGASDVINTDGVIDRNCGEVILDDTQDLSIYTKSDTMTSFKVNIPNAKPSNFLKTCISDKFKFIYRAWDVVEPSNLNQEGISIGNSDRAFYVRLTNSRLGIISSDSDLVKIQKCKTYLKQNPLNVTYELADDKKYKENTNKTLIQKAYPGGYLQVNAGPIQPNVKGSYSTNICERFLSIEEAVQMMNDQLGGVWKTLLALADRELRMKVISLLTTQSVLGSDMLITAQTITVLTNKINEILNVWR